MARGSLSYSEYQQYIGLINNIPIIKLMYIIGYPLTRLFVFFNLKPNTITTISNVTALVSFYYLFNKSYLFVLFWVLSILLDYCDGVVARATNLLSSWGRFYDHASDLIKLYAFFVVVGVSHNNIYIWILVSLNISLYSLRNYLNRESSELKDRLPEIPVKIKNAIGNNPGSRNILKSYLSKFPQIKKILVTIYSSIFVIWSNYYLWLSLVIINTDFTIYILILSCVVLFKNMYGKVKSIKQSTALLDAQNN